MFFGQATQGRIYCHYSWGNCQLLALVLLMGPNAQLPVALDHSQLRVIASNRLILLAGHYRSRITEQNALDASCTVQIMQWRKCARLVKRTRFCFCTSLVYSGYTHVDSGRLLSFSNGSEKYKKMRLQMFHFTFLLTRQGIKNCYNSLV